jgi:hypothetical protein
MTSALTKRRNYLGGLRILDQWPTPRYTRIFVTTTRPHKNSATCAERWAGFANERLFRLHRRAGDVTSSFSTGTIPWLIVNLDQSALTLIAYIVYVGLFYKLTVLWKICYVMKFRLSWDQLLYLQYVCIQVTVTLHIKNTCRSTLLHVTSASVSSIVTALYRSPPNRHYRLQCKLCNCLLLTQWTYM